MCICLVDIFPLFHYFYFPYLQLSCLLYCSRDLLDIAWSLGVLIPGGNTMLILFSTFFFILFIIWSLHCDP